MTLYKLLLLPPFLVVLWYVLALAAPREKR
jgi:hypothetical protein